MSTDRHNLYHALQKPGITPEDAERRQRASAELEAANPLLELPAEAFLELLRSIVRCHAVVSARPSTKTHIEFRHGLLLLEGKAPQGTFGFQLDRAWDWESLAQLQLDPFMAFAYRRMVRDIAAMTVKAAKV